MSNANVTLVQSLYAAFERGDIATIINALAPDVDWQTTGRRADFPTFGQWHGPAEVQQFFALVGEHLAFYEFSPKDFHAVDDMVLVFGHYAATVKKTGRKAQSDWIHCFNISGGKVARFREFLDTASFAEGYRG